MKRIYSIILVGCVAMTLGMTSTMASAVETPMESIAVAAPETPDISISVSGTSVRVTGANKMTLTIYNLTGRKAASFQIESDDQTISTGLNKGVYLLKVGKVVRKVSLS